MDGYLRIFFLTNFTFILINEKNIILNIMYYTIWKLLLLLLFHKISIQSSSFEMKSGGNCLKNEFFLCTDFKVQNA